MACRETVLIGNLPTRLIPRSARDWASSSRCWTSLLPRLACIIVSATMSDHTSGEGPPAVRRRGEARTGRGSHSAPHDPSPGERLDMCAAGTHLV